MSMVELFVFRLFSFGMTVSFICRLFVRFERSALRLCMDVYVKGKGIPLRMIKNGNNS